MAQLSSEQAELIDCTTSFVAAVHSADRSGHDWGHISRVWRLAMWLAEAEDADRFVTALIALLHDVDDPKLGGAGRRARSWLEFQEVDEPLREATLRGIAEIAFSANDAPPSTLEAQVVQDADRLDALGAIGIARAFTYGGHIGQPLHDPAAWRADPSAARTTTGHMWRKLSVLEDRINTDSARALARRRQAYLNDFLERLIDEADLMGPGALDAAELRPAQGA